MSAAPGPDKEDAGDGPDALRISGFLAAIPSLTYRGAIAAPPSAPHGAGTEADA